jgi:chemotaxis protein MotB
LREVALLLANDPHVIEVEGHTDNVPISNALFPSNWELSATRASSVVRLFIDSGVAASRLTAVGKGANVPLASNADPAGRARNRRVAVAIISALPDMAADSR